ncbi:MAG: ureidoglycolate lyase [Frankiales bacterium]|nr:ureidoglycolate lyase [Frankiales bacterium]
MTDDVTHWVQAEPLTPEAFAPYGQVVGFSDVQIELRDQEVFHLDIIAYKRKPIRVDHLNRHATATQALVPLNGKPVVIIVGAPELTFSNAEDLGRLRAFLFDGSRGINIALKVWHEGPFPLMEHVDLVNVQGKHVDDDNEVAHLQRDLGAVVGVRL